MSVVMIGHRSEDLLKRAISSLLKYSSSSSRWELVLIVNGDHPGVGAFAQALLREELLPVGVVKISERRPGAARNAGVAVARAEVLFFLDDDIESFQDIVGAALELFRDPALQAAGGANLTPPFSGALARATGGMMATRMGAASMRQRYRVTKEGPASEHGLILCNLAVRKSVFEAEQGFAVHLISNEENVLLQKLAAKKARLWSSPRLAVFHCRRDSWMGLASQACKYGGGRAQNLLLVPESFRALYLLPLGFLLYISSLPVLLLFLGKIAALPLGIYLFLAAAYSLKAACVSRDPAHLLGVLVFPCVHLSYGWGFLRAVCAWGSRRKQLREHVI